jgi:rhamnulokinase
VRSYAAIDLGASSGRVMVGTVGPGGTIALDEVHRFANRPVRLPDGLHWDITGLFQQILDGLRAAHEWSGASLRSVGVDSWAIDYGLLDARGALLGIPYHYRDTRTEDLACPVEADRLYRVTGLQHLPFNTIYQLLAEPDLSRARALLLVPDLLTYWLTGRIGAERTNVSTTGLYDVTAGTWSAELISRLGLPPAIFPALREPGDVVGALLPPVRQETGLDIPVVAIGSHDTASAVVAVPAETDHFAYVSCGTWSLVGVELTAPVLTEASRVANFTNEVGVDGTIRYLRNVMGLWLLQECQREWGVADPAELLAAAAFAPPFAALVDPDDTGFLAPGDMPARIAAYCERTGQQPPTDPPAVVRCVLDSLAVAHRSAVRDAVALSGRTVEVVHLVGGGARNTLLCQLTADACGVPVLAGPVEATALGNVLVQARADGGPADLAAMRRLVASAHRPVRYEPRGSEAAWDKAAARIGRH